MNQTENVRGNWVSLKPEIVKFQVVGDSFEEKLLKVEAKGTGKYGSRACYLRRNGRNYLVFLTKVLKRKIELAEEGDHIRIELTGTEPSDKGNDTKLFEVCRLEGSEEAVVTAVKSW